MASPTSATDCDRDKQEIYAEALRALATARVPFLVGGPGGRRRGRWVPRLRRFLSRGLGEHPGRRGLAQFRQQGIGAVVELP